LKIEIWLKSSSGEKLQLFVKLRRRFILLNIFETYK
jgi:hypothetical protein